MKDKRKLAVWPWRRIVQGAILLALIAFPLVARYNHYLAARQLDKQLERWEGSTQGLLLGLTDRVARIGIPDGEGGVSTRRPRKAILERTRRLHGSPWSAEVGGVSLTDPLAAAESSLASRSVPWVLVVGLAVPVLLTLLLGRFFCGWICPMGLLFDMGAKVRALLPKLLEINPLTVRLGRGNKYVLLGIGLVLTLFTGTAVLNAVYPPAILGREAHSLVFALFDRAEDGRPGLALVGVTGASVFLLALLLIEVFVAPRFWCQALCPGGALYALLGRFRLLRVRRVESLCIDCAICDEICPRGELPMTDRSAAECDNCGDCIDACPTRALKYRVAISSGPILDARPLPMVSNPPTDTDPEDDVQATGQSDDPPPTGSPLLPKIGTAGILLLAGALALFCATEARAHHIMGIPHYSYDENYPQAPVVKLLENVGPWELQLTGYPGKPVPGVRTELHVYAVDTKSRKLFDQPMTITVTKKSLFGGGAVIYGPKKSSLKENVFKFYPTYPEEGNYEINLAFPDGEVVSTLTFPMVAGDPGSPWLTSGGFLTALLLFVLVIRSIRIKRARRLALETA